MNRNKKILPFFMILIGITIIVTIHELGHFIMCKIFNVKTPVFSVGFGPKLLGLKIGETLFQVAALPFGGYVSIDQDSLNLIGYSQKMAIVLAGVIFNLIFAVIMFFIFYIEKQKNITDPENNSSDLRTAFANALRATIKTLKQTSRIFLDLFSGEKKNGKISGPIGIFKDSDQIINESNLFILFLASFSVQLAFFNTLPFPLFDGGKALLYTIEALMGKPLSASALATINIISMGLLLAFMLYLTFRDIKNMRAEANK